MRRTGAALIASVVMLGATSTAGHAGEAAIDGDGNFLVTDASLTPPKASKRGRPQPVTLDFHQLFANYRSGAQPPRSTQLVVQLPRDLRVNSSFVARCPLPASDADIRADRCSAASRIGSGTAVADARSLGASGAIPATVTAYNGAELQGNPTLILQGQTQLGGATVVVEFNFQFRRGGTGPFGLQAVSFDPYPVPPPAPGSGYITLTSLNLKVGKTVSRRQRGRRVRRGLLEAPSSCPRAGWSFGSRFTLDTGSVLDARDTTPCTR